MEFRKRLKTRSYIAVGYMAIGIVLIALYLSGTVGNTYFFSLGLALVVMGIVRVMQYKRITRDEDSIRRRQIAETDERNVSISNRAKSAAFAVYILLASTGAIVFELLEKSALATLLAASVCALVALYWVSYWIIRKKS